MRINLQKLTLSTLTFSLATTLAVGGFSESASARNRGSGYGSSQNLPALNFEVFLENEDGTDIKDAEDNENLGIFKNAIEIINDGDTILTDVFDNGLENGAIAGKDEDDNIFDGSLNGRAIADFSAKLNDDNTITYQIFQGEYEDPDQFLKFAPVDVSSRSEIDIKNLVNNLQFILDDGNEGKFDVTAPNNFKPEQVGVLGKAIGLSLKYSEEIAAEDENDPDKKKEEFEKNIDFLKITKFDSQPSTSIPEPTTTLASIFALGFAGKFLRKSKKSNASIN